MKNAYPDLPGWTFEVEEVSANVYRATGVDAVGRRVEMTGTDEEALEHDCRDAAARITAQVRSKRHAEAGALTTWSTESDELHGAEAVRFAAERLRRLRSNADTWETEYVDDATGELWVMDYPHGELQGGGSPRLRKQPRR